MSKNLIVVNRDNLDNRIFGGSTLLEIQVGLTMVCDYNCRPMRTSVFILVGFLEPLSLDFIYIISYIKLQ